MTMMRLLGGVLTVLPASAVGRVTMNPIFDLFWTMYNRCKEVKTAEDELRPEIIRVEGSVSQVVEGTERPRGLG